MNPQQAMQLLQKTLKQISLPYDSHIQLLTALEVLYQAGLKKEPTKKDPEVQKVLKEVKEAGAKNG